MFGNYAELSVGFSASPTELALPSLVTVTESKISVSVPGAVIDNDSITGPLSTVPSTCVAS